MLRETCHNSDVEIMRMEDVCEYQVESRGVVDDVIVSSMLDANKLSSSKT
jgi:hypothetical protein